MNNLIPILFHNMTSMLNFVKYVIIFTILTNSQVLMNVITNFVKIALNYIYKPKFRKAKLL